MNNRIFSLALTIMFCINYTSVGLSDEIGSFGLNETTGIQDFRKKVNSCDSSGLWEIYDEINTLEDTTLIPVIIDVFLNRNDGIPFNIIVESSKIYSSKLVEAFNIVLILELYRSRLLRTADLLDSGNTNNPSDTIMDITKSTSKQIPKEIIPLLFNAMDSGLETTNFTKIHGSHTTSMLAYTLINLLTDFYEAEICPEYEFSYNPTENNALKKCLIDWWEQNSQNIKFDEKSGKYKL